MTVSHRRVIVIWPLANGPEHEFKPVYVPVIVMVVRLTCAVPVALDEHPDDIMLPVGRSIVKVMSSPDMVPRKDPAVRPCMPEPEKLIGPVTMDPFCVSCHVIVPMSICPIMLPAPSELLESNPMPDHIPAMDADGDEPDGAVEALPLHAAANQVNRTTANVFFIFIPLREKASVMPAAGHATTPAIDTNATRKNRLRGIRRFSLGIVRRWSPLRPHAGQRPALPGKATRPQDPQFTPPAHRPTRSPPPDGHW